MRYIVVDAAEYTYPGEWSYRSAANAVTLDTPRRTYAATQILLSDVPDEGKISVKTDGLPFSCEIYGLYPVNVERNEGIAPENRAPHYPERIAPFLVYDCLRPYDGTIPVTKGDGGLYLAFVIPEETKPGTYKGQILVEDVRVPVTIEVYAAVVPEETLTIIQGYAQRQLEPYFHVQPGTPEWDEMDRRCIALLRRMHQNMMYMRGPIVTNLGDNRYAFDFTPMEESMRRYFALGMKFFNGPSVGWRKSWHESTILVNGDIPSMSYEGYCYLSQYLPALHNMLEKNGWLDKFIMGVADEPNTYNATEFRALCGLIRKFVPDIRLVDAMSYGNLHGALDIWVPLNAEYDRHQKEMETLRANGDEIWHYVCCGPREPGYINRFMDYPLLSTRYLFWGNYRYNLTGYLHWAAMCYQPGQDPFTENCPEHHNTDSVCHLPAGDTHLIYPSDSGPWMSIRLENHRARAEEYEMLKKLAETDRARADAICAAVFRSFRDVEYDPHIFRAARRELLKALS